MIGLLLVKVIGLPLERKHITLISTFPRQISTEMLIGSFKRIGIVANSLNMLKMTVYESN